jgi:hypothetical protein
LNTYFQYYVFEFKMHHIKQNNNLHELSINKNYFSQDVTETIQHTPDYARKYIRPNIIGIITQWGLQ